MSTNSSNTSPSHGGSRTGVANGKLPLLAWLAAFTGTAAGLGRAA